MQGSLLSDEELWTVLWEVASGLEFLHAHGVLHLDIKPENIYRSLTGGWPAQQGSAAPLPACLALCYRAPFPHMQHCEREPASMQC